MSLILSIPFNNSVRNIGLQKNTITSIPSVTPSYIAGPVNNALSFNGSTYWKSQGITLGTEATICFWSKTSTNGKMPWVLESDASNLLCLYESSYYTLNTGDGNSNLFKTVSNASISVLRDNVWHHFAVTFGDGVAKLYIDGLYKGKAITFRNPTTTNKPIKIGGGYQNAHSYDWNGGIADFRVYDHCLMESDVLRIYNNRSIFEIPYSQEAEKPEYPLWLKLLHHNAPANNIFTAANCKKNSDNDLYSRCGWLFGNTIFKLDNGKYEMLAKEKAESGSTENIFRWTQTSSPTASTITGFNAIVNVSGSHLLGLKHNGSYAALHNGSTYWCACGSYTKYNGGNPGFRDIIKSGYLDLFVRAEIKHLPSKYEELEYITFNGTHYFYIDKPSGTHSSMKIEFGIEPDTLSHSQPTFFSGKNSGVQIYRQGTQSMGLWTSNGSMSFGNFISGQKNSLTIELTSSLTKANLNGNINQSTTALAFDKFFATGCTQFTVGAYNVNSYCFFGNLYGLKIYIDESLYFLGIPAKRKNDNVIGMYDMVSKQFFTNKGTGSFTGA